MPQEPWEYLAMGFNSPSSLGVKLLVVTDYFSRYTAVTIMKETDAVRVEDQLEDLFDTYGYPACLRADNGPPFSSKELSNWCVKRGIKIGSYNPLGPWMNGEAEAQMKGIIKALSIAVGNGENWKLALQQHIHSEGPPDHTAEAN
ncbi:MAG: DDE-type integrase/transposase/recombinase [Propionibacteriaceae bacterium]